MKFLLGVMTATTLLAFGLPDEPLHEREIPHHREQYPTISYGEVSPIYREASILFVPDIMLGRRVETISKVAGYDYPFRGMTALLDEADLTVGNLEGTVPDVHVPTPELTTRFSFQRGFVEELHAQGFDVLSLANNHALDFGEEGYLHTQSVCKKETLSCVGHPNTLDASSILYRTLGDSTVGILMIHALYGVADQAHLLSLVKQMEEVSDVQVVFVHWGEEYADVHRDTDEKLAHALIDAGIDAIIGHHPHVVQDIALYKGKLIFYSLGNFIFDQYFSDAVQEGFGVLMTIRESDITYTLIPYESKTVRSQPRPLSLEDRDAFLLRVLPSEFFTYGERHTGTLTALRE